MKESILIVEDEFLVANDLKMMLIKAGYQVCGIAPSVAKAKHLITLMKPDWLLVDIFLQGNMTGIDLATDLTSSGIPFIYISANTNQGVLEAAKATLPYGFLVKPFREMDLLIMLDIARYRHEQNRRYSAQQEPTAVSQLQLILQKQDTIATKLEQVGSLLNEVLPFEHLWVTRSTPRSVNTDINLQNAGQGRFKLLHNSALLLATGIAQRAFKRWTQGSIALNGQFTYNGYAFKKLRMEHEWIKVLSDHFKLESALFVEVEVDAQTFQFIFFSAVPDFYTSIHIGVTDQFLESFKMIICQLMLGKDPHRQNLVSASSDNHIPVKTAIVALPVSKIFKGIIGESKLLMEVFRKLELVAPDETSVLILGESGTGKERIARTIHELSPRRSKALVTINCAALPLSLIESELFGHEKGSFTGAGERRIGKFEQADGGTIFLDEIGELPPEAQVKLLRVLQEKEIERIGGNSTKKIDVRIITATNRNLEKEVAEGRFRLDLYYRLNVFPVELPSLRQRKEDIPLLVAHFIDKFNTRSGSNITGISASCLQTLNDYEWPGNIRELEHLIERTMLLTTGQILTEVTLPVKRNHAVATAENSDTKTLDEVERDYILKILNQCSGRIYGSGGAAELLNVASTTLNAKIKRLGITYQFVK